MPYQPPGNPVGFAVIVVLFMGGIFAFFFSLNMFLNYVNKAPALDYRVSESGGTIGGGISFLTICAVIFGLMTLFVASFGR